MKYAFFPGCTMADRLPFIEKSVRAISPHFGLELVDLPFSCCPDANSVRSFSDLTWLSMGARNLAIAEEAGLDIMAACSGCFESLSTAKHELDSDPSKKSAVNEILANIGKEYKGEVNVVHLHQVLFEEIGMEKIASKVVNPISMQVVTHPGCHLLRPEKVLEVDNAEYPTKFDDLVRALGMESIDYMDKLLCCGAGVRGTNRDVAFAVLRDKMNSMMMVEPQAVVVMCPTCFISFEAGQRVVNRMFGTEINLPVYYYTELLAYAMNLPEVEQILDEHRVKSSILEVRKEEAENEDNQTATTS